MPFMFPFLAFTGWDDIIIIMQNKLVAKVPQRERGKWEKSCPGAQTSTPPPGKKGSNRVSQLRTKALGPACHTWPPPSLGSLSELPANKVGE